MIYGHREVWCVKEGNVYKSSVSTSTLEWYWWIGAVCLLVASGNINNFYFQQWLRDQWIITDRMLLCAVDISGLK